MGPVARRAAADEVIREVDTQLLDLTNRTRSGDADMTRGYLNLRRGVRGVDEDSDELEMT